MFLKDNVNHTQKKGGRKLTVKAKEENLEAITGFADAFLEERNCPLRIQTQIELCIEEIFVNIANYAYGDGEGDAEFDIEEINGEVTLTFADSGTPYNPLEKDDPDITLSTGERRIGGLGIFLVKKNMDRVGYKYENGKNIFSMTKIINQPGSEQ